MAQLSEKRLFLLDMDGTIYLDERLFDGVPEFLRYVRRVGGRYLFLTNNSSRGVEGYIEKMHRLGINTCREDYLTSVDATIRYLRASLPGRICYVAGTVSFMDQLAQAGITIPSLTIDNYTTVLGGVLAQLDEAGTLAEQAAREQVTAAVEAARDQIRAAVTEAVQQQVTAQVTEQVRQQVLGQVLNAMGYTMEQYQQSPELKAQVDAAVELQMQTPAMQQTISKNVTALMGTEEIRQKIDAATEQQVQLKIEETMASDEVQQKIMAATEQASAGAVQIRSLKQQLDQYNVFYMGLNSYTAGVDQAAAGARQLQSNMPALLDGVKQLRDGAMQLSDGLKQFNEEGVEKLVSVLGDDVEGLAERLTATVEVSRNYRSFSGLTDGMDGAVRFIYRTEAVEKAE